jgi:DNA-directed RNA polymerase subunit RPC12/RpoP
LIRILENNFNFIVAKEDLNTLLKKIDPKNQKVDSYMNFKFQHNLAGREIILHYQKTLADGKRPDFIIEITHGTRNIQLILDSKFKNYNYKQTIVYESLAMFEKYSNNRDNYVFVLHPCKDGVFENRKVKYTNHGGERFYFNSNNENNQVFPFHKYGFVECKPNTTDALKKLIGMGFEYLLESNKNAKTDKLIDPKPEFPLFCISCGKEDVNIKTNSRGENRFYHICNCNNPECGLVSHIDYCWNCKSKLFKHGSFWDYHLESIYNVMDIRCPNCGMTMADRPK